MYFKILDFRFMLFGLVSNFNRRISNLNYLFTAGTPKPGGNRNHGNKK